MADLDMLHALIEPVISDSGFDLVRIALFPQPQLTLQIMVEDPATGQMQVDDCAALSRQISVLLDEVDPIPGEYVLEVSSPGIDRPLARRIDYERWAGHVARIEIKQAIAAYGADRRRFQGHLLGLDEEDVRLQVEGLGEVRLPLANVDKAKLVLTDELLAATARPATGVDESGAGGGVTASRGLPN